MLTLRFGDTAVVVLEAGNLAQLTAGKPATLPFSAAFGGDAPRSFVLAYTPDVEWLTDQVLARTKLSMDDPDALLKEGLKRPPIDRSGTPSHPPLIRNTARVVQA